jgi:hypothetical protein
MSIPEISVQGVPDEAQKLRRKSMSFNKEIKIKPKTLSAIGKFVEWNETTANSEKWPYKQTFEDVEFVTSISSSFKEKLSGWRRPADFFQTEKEKLTVVNEVENMEEGNIGEDEDSGMVSPTQNLGRNSFRVDWKGDPGGNAVISAILLISSHKDRIVQEDFLWNLIWPKGKRGEPIINLGGRSSLSFSL